jgi:ATP/maltotriose-dependent transcriptional regulator MalT
MSVEEDTIKFHLHHIFQKLSIKRRNQLGQYLAEARQTLGNG